MRITTDALLTHPEEEILNLKVGWYRLSKMKQRKMWIFKSE